MQNNSDQKKQLMMFRYAAPVPDTPLPEGWIIRSMKEDEGAVWAMIAMQSGFFAGDMDPQQCWMDAMGRDPGVRPENVFFACDDTGKPLATATARLLTEAECGQYPPAPEGLGYLHYVATLPQCRGKRSGPGGHSGSIEALRPARFGRLYPYNRRSQDSRPPALSENGLDSGSVRSRYG